MHHTVQLLRAHTQTPITHTISRTLYQGQDQGLKSLEHTLTEVYTSRL